MKEYQSLSYTRTRWDCKYHIVFILKRRKKIIYGALRKHLGDIFKELAIQRECKIVEGHLMVDHVHVCLSVPPKYSVSIARHFGGRQRNFTGEVFWARGYFVSTVGLDEQMVREYIRNQEKEDDRYDQVKFPAANLRLCRR